ncbi:MAG: multicopper oxidase domain-containing protein [Dehalococcoidia bacterium]|nr:multicopper oxidase domain-containing protein [Dehalococcoidia bacterium]
MRKGSTLGAPGLIALLAALALVFVGCGDDDGGAAEVEEGAGGVQEVTVVASDDFAFDPSEFSVVVDRPVRITLDNSEATLLHDLTIEGLAAEAIESGGAAHEGEDEAATEEPEADHEDEAELHVAADPGGTAVLEFTPTETGDFVFYCTVEGHRESGMEGTITVVEE